MAERLLDVDVLSGVNRIDHHAGMPVIGRGDNHGFYRRVIQQSAVVGMGFGAFRSRLQSGGKIRLIHIANGGNVGSDFLELG